MKAVLLFVSFVCLVQAGFAQNYKWLKGGGSSTPTSFGPTSNRVRQICTDANKNIYITAVVDDDNITADTFYRASSDFPSGGYVPRLLLASYTCDGTLRWAKMLQSRGEDDSYGLGYANGGIYFAGVLNGSYISIGDDTSINSGYMQECVVRFDTSGNFKWVRFIGGDSAYTYVATSGNAWYATPFAVDGQGYAHFYPVLRSNLEVRPGEFTVEGTYDLKYDTAGNLLSAIRLPIDSTEEMDFVVINQKNNVAYAALGLNVLPSSSYATPIPYLAAFNKNGTLLWSDTARAGNGYFTGISYDNSGSIYATTWGQDPCIFAGDSVGAPYSKVLTVLFDLDTNGHLKRYYDLVGNGIGLYAVTAQPNGHVAATGYISRDNWHGTKDTFNHINTGATANPILFIWDSSANLLQWNQFAGGGPYHFGYTIVSDSDNNLYLGGMMQDSITVDNLPKYHSPSHAQNFWLAKYGYNCNCTIATQPTPMFTVSGDSMHVPDNVTFTYTGSNTPDSVRWNFGDGNSSTILNPTHSYTDTGIIKVCLTVYGCDSGTYCKYITTLPPLHVSNLAAFPNISVYPNPMSNALFITGITKRTQIKLYDILGQQVYSGVANNNQKVINAQELTVGTYILQLTNPQGQRMSMNVVKQ
ncbi:MAG: T9SS type A sorting domain-containing protein [Bacteroidetes bacterium]|nr:T9SS type A sorting domain-containing protein [Bacteroidota bacterium]